MQMSEVKWACLREKRYKISPHPFLTFRLKWVLSAAWPIRGHAFILVYSAFSSFFSKTLFDFKKSISGLIELKFSGKTPNEVLYAPIYFLGVYF